jgi:hypothetical protein
VSGKIVFYIYNSPCTQFLPGRRSREYEGLDAPGRGENKRDGFRDVGRGGWYKGKGNEGGYCGQSKYWYNANRTFVSNSTPSLSHFFHPFFESYPYIIRFRKQIAKREEISPLPIPTRCL